MGLDMYLDRLPRFEDVDANTVMAIEDYFGWVNRDEKYKGDTFEQWCGRKLEELPDVRTIEYFRQFYTTRYYAWDDEHKYPHTDIHESVGYWRKANQIHGWFVENVQNGEDDCRMYEVTKGELMELRDLCLDVLAHCVLIKVMVKNGQQYENGKWSDIIEDGKVIVDPTYAEEMLPHTTGCFFGNDGYNEWYVDDLVHTVEVLNKVLETTDFERQMICYCSSW